MLAMTACSDELVAPQTDNQNPLNQDKGIGQLVLFSSGSSGNTTTRAVIPYMEQEGRFVCKMYYHAKATDTDASAFDVETTPITSWLRVNDKEGNSVYWNREFPDNTDDELSDYRDLTEADREDPNYKDYGFDPNAQFFYWRNRLDHIFLAYTDFNLLKGNTYALTNNKNKEGNYIPVARSLFMYPEADGEKKTKTGQIESWLPQDYKQLKLKIVEKDNPDYTADDPYPYPEKISVLQTNGTDKISYPSRGLHFPLMNGADYYDPYNHITIEKEKIEKTLELVLSIVDATTALSDDDKTELKKDLTRTDYTNPPESTSEGTFKYGRWWVGLDPTVEGAFNDDGSVNLFKDKAIIYCEREKQKIEDVIATAPANVFDMRRTNDMHSMADQPDPLIAWTKMKPTGATQEANRVRLYFEHQFSQIQVNLTKGENTPELSAKNIVSVELLGVTEKAYVFTNINPNGTQIPPSYDAVVMSKYSEEDQKKNPYGTSFNMFDMGDNKQQTALKSFNAIAFGQLQAIRITWKEEDYVEDGETKEGIHHVATYKITVDERGQSLVNLKSGYRYVYDFELRRGTIAFIRATIDGWRLSDDLNYGTSGTIAPETTSTP